MVLQPKVNFLVLRSSHRFWTSMLLITSTKTNSMTTRIALENRYLLVQPWRMGLFTVSYRTYCCYQWISVFSHIPTDHLITNDDNRLAYILKNVSFTLPLQSQCLVRGVQSIIILLAISCNINVLDLSLSIQVGNPFCSLLAQVAVANRRYLE